MQATPWEAYAYYDEKNLRQECTCPNCKVIWQHYNDKVWVKDHFGSAVDPVTCPECGIPSVAGGAKRYKPRKLYVEPTPQPVLTRTERHKPGWFGRKAREVEPPDYERSR